LVELWLLKAFGSGLGGLRKIPRVVGEDGFLWEALNRWVETGKFLKE